MAKMKRVCFVPHYNKKEFIHIDDITNEMYVGVTFDPPLTKGVVSENDCGDYNCFFPFDGSWDTVKARYKKEVIKKRKDFSIFYATEDLKTFKKWLVNKKKKAKKPKKEKWKIKFKKFPDKNLRDTYEHLKKWEKLSEEQDSETSKGYAFTCTKLPTIETTEDSVTFNFDCTLK